jgi:reductive dehalogenase
MGTLSLSVINFCLIIAAFLFTYESFKEQEPRAPIIGLAVIIFHLILGILIPVFPVAQMFVWIYYAILILLSAFLLIPSSNSVPAKSGTKAIIAGDVVRFDERDQVFARNETIRPDRKEYELYYKMRPEYKARDDQRRTKGGDLGNPGSIDQGHPANVNMLFSCFGIGRLLESYAVNIPDNPKEQVKMEPARATEVVKGFARQLGADLVGICKINKNWIYSHRGEIHGENWDEWGTKIQADLPYAVIIATEMKKDMIAGAPHTPSTVESTINYAKGAHITTALAHWFSNMGYHASAQHEGHYDALMVPLAVDAGLGQLGRQGYLIADKFGSGVRLFAVLTDMALVSDKPIDLGVEEFCNACLKCAEACPSKSIPLGEKVEFNGISKWKLNAETCHDYWGKVGTDCCVCMAICPYTRPDKSIHKAAKWFLKRSKLARSILPHLDNFVYGRKWKSRRVPKWVDYRLK